VRVCCVCVCVLFLCVFVCVCVGGLHAWCVSVFVCVVGGCVCVGVWVCVCGGATVNLVFIYRAKKGKCFWDIFVIY